MSEYINSTVTLGNVVDYITPETFGERWHLDLIYQRRSGNWSKEEINMYLTTLLNGDPVPSGVLCKHSNGKIYVVDAKQRITIASEFIKGKIRITKNGALRSLIKYEDFVYDEDGKIVYDENGEPIKQECELDVVGKTFNELPKPLKDLILRYNLHYVMYLNCSDDDIKYHIARYNSQVAMNTNQKVKLRASELVASNMNKLELHTFFKEWTKFTKNSINRGVVATRINEIIMLMFFFNDYIGKAKPMIEFLDKNATQEMYDKLEEVLNRLEEVSNSETTKLFDPKEACYYIALFNKFDEYKFDDDSLFMDFLNYVDKKKEDESIVVNDLTLKVINATKGSTKDKKFVTAKFTIFSQMMNKYFFPSEDVEEIECDFTSENNNYELMDNHYRSFINEFSECELINNTNCTTDDDIEMAIKSLMIYDGKTEVDKDSIKHEISESTYSQDVFDDVIVCTDMLEEYLFRNVKDNDEFATTETIPALINIVNVMALVNEEDDDFINKWFSEYSNIYSVDTFDDMDSYQIFDEMYKDYIGYRTMLERAKEKDDEEKEEE